MPVNSPENEDEFISILSEITSIHLEHEDYSLIVAGDFNVDLASGDARGATLRVWAQDVGVTCPAMAPDAPRRTTFTGPNGNTALLDYVFMTESLSDNVEDWYVKDSGDNLSDHSPKIVKIKADTEYVPVSDTFISKPMWNKATEAQKAAYLIKLDKLLSNIDINNEAVSCKDLYCNNHKFEFMNLLESTLGACAEATRGTIPYSRQPQLHGMPGWNELVRQKRADAMFWHARWNEVGRPRDGWKGEMRRRTRVRYHAAAGRPRG